MSAIDPPITFFRCSRPSRSRMLAVAAAGGQGMDLYHIWCDLKPGISDLALAESASEYLDYLKSRGLIERWRLTRRKLGLAVAGLGEFHIIIETKDLAQLEQAFQHVASRAEPVESVHFALNSLVQNAVFGLYRDFPDAARRHGEEKF